MKNIFPSILFIGLFIQLVGCTPRYVFSPEEKTAAVKILMNDGQVNMCRDGKLYSLKIDHETGKALIPTGKRVALLKSVQYSGYQTTFSCYPRLGFTPKDGETYITDMNLIGNRCLLELVKENDSTDSSVELEPSLGQADCFRR